MKVSSWRSRGRRPAGAEVEPPYLHSILRWFGIDGQELRPGVEQPFQETNKRLNVTLGVCKVNVHALHHVVYGDRLK